MAFPPEQKTWRQDVSLVGPVADAELAKIRSMYARLEGPLWMPKPDEWAWVRPSDNRTEGIALIARIKPGVANLLWLALAMETPPWEYEMAKNPLMTYILVYAEASKLCGEPLVDLAGMLSLAQFHELLAAAHPAGNPLESVYYLLHQRSEERLGHA